MPRLSNSQVHYAVVVEPEMFCDHCGHGLDAESRYCSHCGHAVTPETRPEKSSRLDPATLLAAIALGLLLLMALTGPEAFSPEPAPISAPLVP
ncbi:zinc-ribbon domain-containing protein [Geitlerinema sp. PCC 7407]|uniref:zinc-ribbon domain-containing protein n=1 Tax=Geitlerinema sp. PCC 7407 TaxID=1173025 RepID=UPI00029FF51E|nr:zinc ribbon domain-containing protein [Geitlerinema sp. PCC 7407]AFY64992.1 hypothetical protein GEI7407_0492 [Geitlerinema sp. PCC 7407]